MHPSGRTVLLTLFLLAGMCPVFGAGSKQLHGHVPEATKRLAAISRLSPTNELHLAIGVPLRDPAGLDKFLADVYDPASPNYRHFLTPAEFTARFSATEADYTAVKNFALTNGFKITHEHGNRLLLEVTARAAGVEHAFRFKLNKFKHPTEAREFFAPDAEPTIDLDLPVADVQGLSDFSRPHSRIHKADGKTVAPKNGSAPDGSSYFGDDFRNAYAAGTVLTGAGQQVGLLQFDGYYPADIASYAQKAGGGRTNIVIQTVLTDSFSGIPTTGVNSGNPEVSLDIEMAMAMAPGLAKIVVFEADPSGNANTILAAMVTNTAIKQFSCSWGWPGPDTTTENYFKQMILQGQSFFSASGDGDAFVDGSNNDVNNSSQNTYPSGSPNITQVGGTVLTMNGTGASYASETVWNDGTPNSNGGYWGSSGGVSTNAIPYWQTNINMTANQGSATMRNIPDVSLTAKNVYVNEGNGSSGSYGGTSCAAPLWAGFMALVNQQAANLGNSSAGFINPAVYAIGKGLNNNYSYAACFNDTTSGDNSWPSSAGKYPAVSGYDLCTGWGTPKGSNLINALAGPTDTLAIAPATGFAVSGVVGGPFTGGSQTFTLTNTSASSLVWSLVNTSAWLTVSTSSGTLAAHQQTNVTVNLAAAANSLGFGSYTAMISFSNQTSHVTQFRQLSLQTLSALGVTPASGFNASGAAGGPFNVSTQNFTLTNLSAGSFNWSIINTSSWLSASPSSGSLAGGATASMAVSLNASAGKLPAGVYSANVLVTNQGITSANLPFTLQVGQSIVQNGGFETGTFADWTLVGNTVSGNITYNTIANASNSSGWLVVHSGSYGAFLGDNQLATLSQVLSTVPGQSYQLSLWLDNPQSGPPQIFLVNWNTNSSATNNIYAMTNPPVFTWTNLAFVVTATRTNTTLQIGAENDVNYFGFDDVSVTPIPTPTVTGYGKVTNGFALTWNTLPGFTNLIQYKTNLLQANWINLATNIATTNVITFTATNGLDPRRFYRVQRSP